MLTNCARGLGIAESTQIDGSLHRAEQTLARASAIVARERKSCEGKGAAIMLFEHFHDRVRDDVVAKVGRQVTQTQPLTCYGVEVRTGLARPRRLFGRGFSV